MAARAAEDVFVPWSTASLGTSPSSLYKEIRQVGKGTYGDVYLGANALTLQQVALKKVSWSHVEEKHRHRGFPLNALREIRLLKKKCAHPNLVKLLDVAANVPLAVESKAQKSSLNEWEEEDDTKIGFVYLVFEYVEHDLAGIVDAYRDKNLALPLPLVKSLIKQLLEALVYIHGQNICHRDLKCSNLLITRNLQLKLADFGLARELNYEGQLSPRVVTLWYRAPELILGDTRYTLTVDIWSVGCILIELLRMSPLFPGKEELDQLRRIFLVCGQPNSVNWPSHADLPLAKNLAKIDSAPKSSSVPYAEANGIEDFCAQKQVDNDAGRIAGRMLALDPARRCSASQALQSNFLLDAPDHRTLPPIEAEASYHEWETKKVRKQAIEQAKLKDPNEPVIGVAAAVLVAEVPKSPSADESAIAETDKAKPSSREKEGKEKKSKKRNRSASVDSRGKHRARRSPSPPRARTKEREKKKDKKSKKHSRNRSRSPSRKKKV